MMWWWIVLDGLLRISLPKRAYHVTVGSISLIGGRAVATLVSRGRLRVGPDPGFPISRYANDNGHIGSMVNRTIWGTKHLTYKRKDVRVALGTAFLCWRSIEQTPSFWPLSVWCTSAETVPDGHVLGIGYRIRGQELCVSPTSPVCAACTFSTLLAQC